MIRTATVLAAALALGACADLYKIPGPLIASFDDGQGFNGTYVIRRDLRPNADGEVTFLIPGGPVCSGTYLYTSDRYGTGALSCADGTTGAFTMDAGSHTGGTYQGQINGRSFHGVWK